MASPGIIIVAITIMNRIFLPLKSKKEKENAASEQDMICPKVMAPATINELRINRPSGIFLMASLKLSRVGLDGNRLSSVVKSSLEGIKAMLTA